ncbi:hypothetical protein AAC387_Pa12g1556 [Persea americana]
MIFFSHIQVISHCFDLEIPQIRELLSFTQKTSNPLRYQAHPSVSRSDSSRKRTKQLEIFKFLAIKLFSALIGLDSDRLRQKPHFDAQSSNLKILNHKEMKKSKLRIQARD